MVLAHVYLFESSNEWCADCTHTTSIVERARTTYIFIWLSLSTSELRTAIWHEFLLRVWVCLSFQLELILSTINGLHSLLLNSLSLEMRFWIYHTARATQVGRSFVSRCRVFLLYAVLPSCVVWNYYFGMRVVLARFSCLSLLVHYGANWKKNHIHFFVIVPFQFRVD